MGNPPFEDVSPIEKGGFPLLCWFIRGYHEITPWQWILPFTKQSSDVLGNPKMQIHEHLSIAQVSGGKRWVTLQRWWYDMMGVSVYLSKGCWILTQFPSAKNWHVLSPKGGAPFFVQLPPPKKTLQEIPVGISHHSKLQKNDNFP